MRASQAWSAVPFPEVVVYTGGRVPAIERERFAGAVGRLLERLDMPGDIRLRITAPERGPMVNQVNHLEVRPQRTAGGQVVDNRALSL
ncbi:hypothetical protein NLM24_21015 [Nocardia zapadnayensis]|uniref:hypothetical protein n=1 Tax=Nocardia rhamnosiphila TaxID=426716 RepID=UPI0022461FFA|nr:hypothetical protein [Nocardia zapadnayensis]MCX0273138.1 hypothetical protein [Nocardia zapadnayensis]